MKIANGYTLGFALWLHCLFLILGVLVDYNLTRNILDLINNYRNPWTFYFYLMKVHTNKLQLSQPNQPKRKIKKTRWTKTKKHKISAHSKAVQVESTWVLVVGEEMFA